MKLKTLIKIVAALIVMLIFAISMIIVARYLKVDDQGGKTLAQGVHDYTQSGKKDEQIVEVEQLYKKIKNAKHPEVVHGQKAFKAVQRMLENGEFQAARPRLEELIRRYPGTPAADEAGRVLGEMKMDELLSVRPNDGKVTYEVKSGDYFIRIAEKNATNLDLILYLNDLKDYDRLRPGQELVLMPLDHLSLRIVPKNNQMMLISNKDGDEEVIRFFEPTQEMMVPKRNGLVRTKVSRITARDKQHPVKTTSSNYRGAEKTVMLDEPRLTICSNSERVDKSFRGIVLAEEDMEELVLMLRSNTRVDIIY